ncbi:nitroreductase family protein [Nocardioides sp. Kera G14]|uniref:nitroreductase family protein n=1 Tax=Nocardioides sp. Kera G14 TaxID=2884264 RepID=UPI001D100BCF|nr:nitroreductase family protein [Nocardioides sp. Kera G14]UDY24425.1 nitroreductase family protein [Nocardioides sp. Kera G14]
MRFWKRRPSDEAGALDPWEDLLEEMTLDAKRYFEHAIRPGGNERYSELEGRQLDASATRQYHRIEKGFSLRATKHPFGNKAIPALNLVLENPKTDHDALYAQEARAVLTALEQWNDGQVRVDDVAPRGDSLPQNPLDPETLAQFITSRHSIRHFEDRPVSRELVTEAVRLAGYAPSVCNRQGWRAHWYDDPERIEHILKLHSGSRGFSDRIPGLFVVTFDIRAFEDMLERNQGWIDGGLFSMTLLLALHGLGLGAVPLNWASRNRRSGYLRNRGDIPDHENIVMLIAVGHPDPEHRVARSARRPVSEILRFGNPER